MIKTKTSKRLISFSKDIGTDALNDESLCRNDTNNIHQEDWQIALSRAVTHPKQLFKRLQLDSQHLDSETFLASNSFRVFATESYLQRIKPKDINDPLLRQILPLGEEILNTESYTNDPLNEVQATTVPGLLHKYAGRALLITNAHCAINCRFCFRKNFSYSGNHYSSANKDAIIKYLKEHEDISELILSGGDPLLLNDKKLKELIYLTEQIPHIQRIRIHTRIPIVLPERITESLLGILADSRLKVVVVVHCNHAQEIDSAVENALHKLKIVCFSLLNQSVLLKGVNDDPLTLINLQHKLFENGVQSYYLHLLDKVKGTHHFDLPLHKAQILYQEMERQLPGYMLPKLVFESPEFPNKVQLGTLLD
jgi:EF-P beta-lysylation protein EpmB